MKLLTIAFLSLLITKSCSGQQDIKDAKVEYTANTRGHFQKLTLQDHKLTVSENRETPDTGKTTTLPDAEWNELVKGFSAIDLGQLSEYKDPTQKRFYDGAAIAHLKITYQGKQYDSKDFDHGTPPTEIAALVNKLTSLAEKGKE